jgi:hypothetical protein
MHTLKYILVAFLSLPAFAQGTANNTSACAASGNPTAGCNGVGIMPFLGNPSDSGLQTTVLNPLPTNVSSSNLHSMLYSGSTTRVMVEYQPWFYNVSPYNGHKNIGMNESLAAQVLKQAQYMKTLGADVTDVDYYGCGASCGESSNQAYNLSVTTALANAIAANPSTTPSFMIMIDGGSFDSAGGRSGGGSPGVGQCPPATGDQSACIVAALEIQVDYLEKTWLTHSYYEKNAKNGHPIVLYFIGEGGWPDTSFAAVFAAVSAHATAGNSCGSGCTYATTVDFVNENAGAFTTSGLAGGYAWPQPNTYSITNQLCWEGSPCTYNYISDFYATARANPSKIAMGVGYKGFNDYNASWGSNRVIAQQCGQVLGFTANAVSTAGYSSSSQLQYFQWATWNDYEESTEIETGVDNCYTINQPTISGGLIHWSLNAANSYASTTTISSFSIYTGTTAPTTLYASGISAAATSYTAPSLGSGQYAWVYMVGKPLIQNRLSPSVTTQPTASTPTFSPASGSYAGTQSVTITSVTGPVKCYTTNGATPATNGTTGCTTGTPYSGAISVTSTTTLKAVAGGTGFYDSAVAVATYTIGGTASAPNFTPAGGVYLGTQYVALTSASGGAVICFNTTGSPATNHALGCTNGTLYNGFITVGSTETLYAVAGGTGFLDSPITSAVYTITSVATVTGVQAKPGNQFSTGVQIK